MSFSVTHDSVIPITSGLYSATHDSKEINLFIMLLALVYMHLRPCCNFDSLSIVSFTLFTLCDVSLKLFSLCNDSFKLFTLYNFSFQLFTGLLCCTGLGCVYIFTPNLLSFSPQSFPVVSINLLPHYLYEASYHHATIFHSSVVHSLDLVKYMLNGILEFDVIWMISSVFNIFPKYFGP